MDQVVGQGFKTTEFGLAGIVCGALLGHAFGLIGQLPSEMLQMAEVVGASVLASAYTVSRHSLKKQAIPKDDKRPLPGSSAGPFGRSFRDLDS